MATVVAVFAHPDDESFICGGSLAKLAQDGHRVVLVCATLGEMGRRMGVPVIATRESIANVREGELRAACTALGVHRLELLSLRDKTLEIQPEKQLARLVFDVLEEEAPDAVITFHDPLGGHPDHCAIGRAATAAYEAFVDQSSKRARLFYVAWGDDVETYRRNPQPVVQMVTVNIRETKAAKLAAFRAHRSQSGLNRSIWGADKKALGNMSDNEYFILTQGPSLKRPNALLDQDN
ncbi:PIG-L family deacetylase [Alicyclobacillus dauci]|uniref:PIG-L family deacetylase n=1 Tax=Alicyclobacillus dauci TaxID=1475485 RepID=A0ABY6YZW6_9BACL|nr:PIG-L family deacetylase [Alicyclobacillus dauci]WAH35863.1 PIG-L family deacetylase [Alicyclobacillus dauci]